MYTKSNDDKLPGNLQILIWARDSKAKGADRLLLQSLILRANKKENYSCFPSYELLAADCNLNTKTLKRSAKELEDQGYIHRKVRRNRSNRFLINLALLKKEFDQAELQRQAKRNAEHGAEEFAEFTNLPQAASDDRHGDDDDAYTGESAFSIEESL